MKAVRGFLLTKSRFMLKISVKHVLVFFIQFDNMTPQNVGKSRALYQKVGPTGQPIDDVVTRYIALKNQRY